MISNLIIPMMVLGIIIYGFKKSINIYDEFLVGVKEGLDIALKLFPTMFAMILAIDILIKSNIISDIVSFLKPLLDFVRFPHELFMLGFMYNLCFKGITLWLFRLPQKKASFN